MKILLLLTLFTTIHFSYDINAQAMSRFSDTRERLDNTRMNTILNSDLVNELRLEDRQKQRLRSVKSMSDELISGLRKDIKRMRLEIELEKLNEDIDENKIYELYDRIAKIHGAIWKETFKKEQEMKSILNKSQLLMREKIMMRNQRDNARLKPNNKRE